EDAHQRPLIRVACQRSAGEQMPALPGPVERGEERSALGQLQLDAGPLLPVADQVAVVAGPERAPRQTEVDRLEQVRLPGAVRSVNHHDVPADIGARLYEVAEPAALDRAEH